MASQEFYYAIYKGRVDKPAIYCSWSQVHPRVTEFEGAEHQKFETLEDACREMSQRGIKDFDSFIQNSVKKNPMTRSKNKYWAVAGGKSTGIFTSWESVKSASEGTEACYRAFKSQEEAVDFIISWKDAFADVERRAIRQALENGWKPRDMKFNADSLLMRDEENCKREEDEQIRLHGIKRGEDINPPKIEELAIKEEDAI